MKNTAIAKVFSDIADLLELKGENVLRFVLTRRQFGLSSIIPRK